MLPLPKKKSPFNHKLAHFQVKNVSFINLPDLQAPALCTPGTDSCEFDRWQFDSIHSRYVHGPAGPRRRSCSSRAPVTGPAASRLLCNSHVWLSRRLSCTVGAGRPVSEVPLSLRLSDQRAEADAKSCHILQPDRIPTSQSTHGRPRPDTFVRPLTKK